MFYVLCFMFYVFMFLCFYVLMLNFIVTKTVILRASLKASAQMSMEYIAKTLPKQGFCYVQREKS